MIHRFVCKNCYVFAEDTNTHCKHICPECGKVMGWDLKGVGIHGNYKHPIHSDALAIAADQVEEHERRFPNIRLDDQHRPIFDNYINHENYLKETGFIKNTKKGDGVTMMMETAPIDVMRKVEAIVR